MKTLLLILRRIGICFIFSLAIGVIFLFTDQWICGEKHGQNSAGGGAAIGMLALAIAVFAWLTSFVGLTIVDIIGKYFGFRILVLSAKTELLFLGLLLVVWVAIASLFNWTHC